MSHPNAPARVSHYRIVRPLLFAFEPERIHRLTLRALRTAGGNPIGRGLLKLAGGAPRSSRGVEIAGIRFRSRVGIGAGFDKDALALRGWAALGAGFAEVGTVTPLASAHHQGGTTCRDFLASYVKDGSESWLQGEACRVARGKWEVRNLRPWKNT